MQDIVIVPVTIADKVLSAKRATCSQLVAEGELSVKDKALKLVQPDRSHSNT